MIPRLIPQADRADALPPPRPQLETATAAPPPAPPTAIARPQLNVAPQATVGGTVHLPAPMTGVDATSAVINPRAQSEGGGDITGVSIGSGNPQGTPGHPTDGGDPQATSPQPAVDGITGGISIGSGNPQGQPEHPVGGGIEPHDNSNGGPQDLGTAIAAVAQPTSTAATTPTTAAAEPSTGHVVADSPGLLAALAAGPTDQNLGVPGTGNYPGTQPQSEPGSPIAATPAWTQSPTPPATVTPGATAPSPNDTLAAQLLSQLTSSAGYSSPDMAAGVPSTAGLQSIVPTAAPSTTIGNPAIVAIVVAAALGLGVYGFIKLRKKGGAPAPAPPHA
jgi:hypothetical protein